MNLRTLKFILKSTEIKKTIRSLSKNWDQHEVVLKRPDEKNNIREYDAKIENDTIFINY